MPIYGVVFDLDGTLADTLADLTDAVNVGLRLLGYPLRSDHEVRQWIGEGMMILCRRAVAAAGPHGAVLDDQSVAAMAAAFTDYYRAHRLDKTAPYPGIPELLDALTARGLKLAVFSNKPHDHTVALMDALFDRWPWSVVEGSREDRPRKPDPAVAREVLARMGLQPRHVLMVGDSAIDIQTARNVGAVAVGVTWGFRDRQELIQAGADHLIDRPADLLTLLTPEGVV